LCASRQRSDPHSTLNQFRAFLRWRKSQPALLWGDVRAVDIDRQIFAIERICTDHRIFAAFNLGSGAVEVSAPALTCWQQIDSVGVVAGELRDGLLRLPPQSAVFAVPIR
jgi:alpha-glucosidase